MEEEHPYHAYPLCWPVDQPRTPANEREWGRFEGTQEQSRRKLTDEVTRLVLGSESRRYMLDDGDLIISTNMPLRRDGQPYAATRRIDDPGVAIYFQRDDRWVCMACDKYDAIWKNMKALAKTIEAMRGIDRWGSRELLDRAFTGFEALPAKSVAVTCWSVLDIPPMSDMDTIKKSFRAKVRAANRLYDPESTLLALTEARDQAMAATDSNSTN